MDQEPLRWDLKKEAEVLTRSKREKQLAPPAAGESSVGSALSSHPGPFLLSRALIGSLTPRH